MADTPCGRRELTANFDELAKRQEQQFREREEELSRSLSSAGMHRLMAVGGDQPSLTSDTLTHSPTLTPPTLLRTPRSPALRYTHTLVQQTHCRWPTPSAHCVARSYSVLSCSNGCGSRCSHPCYTVFLSLFFAEQRLRQTEQSLAANQSGESGWTLPLLNCVAFACNDESHCQHAMFGLSCMVACLSSGFVGRRVLDIPCTTVW